MKVHLVHAHPEQDSFVAAMRDMMLDAFAERGDEVTLSDLYAMRFNPVISAADFGLDSADGHVVYALEQRRAWQQGTIAADIRDEVEKVLAADLVAFTFPIFWYSTPAILKGWIDRVFLSGAFYGGRRIYGSGGLSGKRAFVAMSLGGRDHMFGKNAIHGELALGMMKHFFQGTLGYVGLGVHEPFVAYHVPYVDEASRKDMLSDLRNTVLKLEDRPVIAMPDLSQFDERFARKT
ncbi:NAD(P)H-dependent oxidoreductase [Sphingomonas sp. 66-10]|uniref:NAD(P)H-dependent oxidoreductase n=1 Tax=Sphingomonas sp. 66-10 TaxID=1895848 RepID=UPI00257B425E|nr:NAD(P)H-dependent oxidoreductase [Sphingomonas sp. 66-10]